MGMGFAYGKGHGKGKPDKPPKSTPPPPPPFVPPIMPPIVPPPYVPPIISPPPYVQPVVRKRNRVTFVTRGVQGIRYRKAEHGFHGIVNRPTHFLVGEKGSEHVNIRPIKSMKKKGSNNDYDFLGDYKKLMGDFKW